MSLFARSYNRFAGSSNSNTNTNSTTSNSTQKSENIAPMNDQNITYRKKLSAVSTSIHGDDAIVAASPRNCYSRNAAFPSSLRRQRVTDEMDGVRMSKERTPVEQRAAEIRRMHSKKEEKPKIENHHNNPPPAPLPPALPIEPEAAAPQTAQNAVEKVNSKKSRTSTSSLASVFRSRASSPIERMRKFIGRSRSSSKQPKDLIVQELPDPEKANKAKEKEKLLIDELEKTRIQLSEARHQLEKYQEKERIPKFHKSSQFTQNQCNVATMTSGSDIKTQKTQLDKENWDPDVICLDDCVSDRQKIRHLEAELAGLQMECAEKTEDFRRTRKDFILILREAVVRKDEAERKLEGFLNHVAEEDDWTTLMSQHRHTLRRNVLLMWVQKKLEAYSISVSNFSSDWTDCRAFCALLSDLFPDLLSSDSPSFDPISQCRRAFQALEIPFDDRALGLSASPTATDSGAEDSSCSSSIQGLTDWRFVMNTVFLIYKRGVLGK